MRKLSTRTLLFVLLVAVSLCSYIFLNTVSVAPSSADNTTIIEENSSVEDLEESELLLPDVQLIKKLLETGKRFIPAT